MTEVEYLRSENARLQALLYRRPAINQGLVEDYIRWTTLCYESELSAGCADGLHDVRAPAAGAH
jgi:hypothetical protein